ncbi:hypothetical protein C8R43DRAFT_977680 [Mycena crocata]|nr:hypothetical protein C8R43DRAFT_977680 [Mycena crocata]
MTTAFCNAGCGKQAEMRCSGCKGVQYCGAECQKKDWKTHKTDCGLDGKPPTAYCTGCKRRFGVSRWIGRSMGTCPDCGYTACEKCITHNRLGTCYCADSNFGHKYCGRVPEWYHFCGRTGQMYRGDNHPSAGDAKSHGVHASEWETEPRECGNCGEMKVCLRPGYTCTNSLCQ